MSGSPEGPKRSERRQFPRLKAPIYCRPAHRRLPRREVVNVGLGGMRVYCDEWIRLGTRLEVEMFFPGGDSLTCVTEVMWIKEIPNGDPAAFDVGLSFLQIPAGGIERIAEVLETSGVPDPDDD